MYLPKELWLVIKGFLLEPAWKIKGRNSFVQQLNILSSSSLDCTQYNSSEVFLFNNWDFPQKFLFWQEFPFSRRQRVPNFIDI